MTRAQILRVPWIGAPVETVYEETKQGYAPSLSLGAIVAGATTWIIRYENEHFFFPSSSIVVLRHGAARVRYRAGFGTLSVLAADEEQIVVGQWGAGGTRLIMRLCADPPKMRAVR